MNDQEKRKKEAGSADSKRGGSNLMEEIVSFCKRRGFIFQSSEIYGGMAGVYDFGPLGVEIKRNFKNYWWKKYVQKRDDLVGVDAGIIMRPKVWEASGHTGEGFADVLFECKDCHKRFRDEELEEAGKKAQDKKKKKFKCPECGGELEEPRMFNILVKTFLGPVEDDSTKTYLRGETAQGMFVNFANVLDSTRKKLPFGMAQIGKAFRNEITPRNFIFRTREFEQAEIEYFVKPEDADKYFSQWANDWEKFFQDDLELDLKKLRMRPHKKKELAHYAKETVDVEYKFPFGWKELAGIANREDFDLKTHTKHSGEDLTYFDQKNKERITPYIIEPTLGIDRAFLAVLVDSYTKVDKRKKEKSQGSDKKKEGEDKKDRNEGRKEKDKDGSRKEEVVLKLPKFLAPYKTAVFPLVKDEDLIEIAEDIHNDVKEDYSSYYDQSGSIGRRYRRQDEIGTPYCITIDFDTKEDKKVTIRDRDTMEQERVRIDKIKDYLSKQF